MNIKLKRLSIYIFLIILFLITITGCRKKTINQKKVYDVGVVFTTDRQFKKGQIGKGVKLRYQIKANESFSGTYVIENHLPKKHKYLVSAILDYEQTELTLGDIKSKYQVLTLNPFEVKALPFNISPVKKGRHDFTIMAFRDPDNHSTGNNFRYSSEALFYYPQRANLIAGLNAAQSYSKGKVLDLGFNDELDGIYLSKSKSKVQRIWSIQEVVKGTNFDYFIHVANKNSIKKDFALIIFLDFRQIPINLNQPLVFYGALGPKKHLTIPANFKAPISKGTHELFSLLAFNPYVEMDEKGKKQIDNMIVSTTRLAILVR